MKRYRRMWFTWACGAGVVVLLALLGGCFWLGGEDEVIVGEVLLSEPVSPIAPVPKTGQSSSYDFAHVDDGGLRKGVAWPNPRFTNNGDGTITDNLTGLIWLRDADCLGAGWWEPSLQKVRDLNTGTECNCVDYTSGTYDDWRLPNVRELLSLIDYSRNNPSLPAGHPFDGVIVEFGKYYWTSTSGGMLAPALYVSLKTGVVDFAGKMMSNYYRWPVRGGP